MVGKTGRFCVVLLVAELGMLGGRGALRADDYTILLEKKDRSKVVVAVLRQELDIERGFDRYFLEEYNAPDNVKVGYEPLGAADREMLLAQGHFELYMRKVEEARANAVRRRKKKGFVDVCNLVLHETGEHQEEVFKTSGGELKVRVTEGKGASVVLDAGEGRTYPLMKLKLPASIRAKVEFAYWGIMQLTVLNKGKMLAVVLRRYTYPSPPQLPEEEIHFFPLKRVARRLGLDYPLKFEACRARNATSQEN